MFDYCQYPEYFNRPECKSEKPVVVSASKEPLAFIDNTLYSVVPGFSFTYTGDSKWSLFSVEKENPVVVVQPLETAPPIEAIPQSPVDTGKSDVIPQPQNLQAAEATASPIIVTGEYKTQ